MKRVRIVYALWKPKFVNSFHVCLVYCQTFVKLLQCIFKLFLDIISKCVWISILSIDITIFIYYKEKMNIIIPKRYFYRKNMYFKYYFTWHRIHKFKFDFRHKFKLISGPKLFISIYLSPRYKTTPFKLNEYIIWWSSSSMFMFANFRRPFQNLRGRLLLDYSGFSWWFLLRRYFCGVVWHPKVSVSSPYL